MSGLPTIRELRNRILFDRHSAIRKQGASGPDVLRECGDRMPGYGYQLKLGVQGPLDALLWQWHVDHPGIPLG
jgi:hypothetical protein